jgi:hypothetical protein
MSGSRRIWVLPAHQLAHELGADLLALTNELDMHPPIPIGLVGMLKHSLDQRGEMLPANRGS